MKVVLIEKGIASMYSIDRGTRKLAHKTDDLGEMASKVNSLKPRTVYVWADEAEVYKSFKKSILPRTKVCSHRVPRFEKYPDPCEKANVELYGARIKADIGFWVTCNARGLVVAFSHKPEYLSNLDIWVPTQTKVIAYNCHQFNMTELMEVNPVTSFRVEGDKSETMTTDQMSILKLMNLQVGESCDVKGTGFFVEIMVLGNPDLMDRNFSLELMGSTTYVQRVKRIA